MTGMSGVLSPSLDELKRRWKQDPNHHCTQYNEDECRPPRPDFEPGMYRKDCGYRACKKDCAWCWNTRVWYEVHPDNASKNCPKLPWDK